MVKNLFKEINLGEVKGSHYLMAILKKQNLHRICVFVQVEKYLWFENTLCILWFMINGFCLNTNRLLKSEQITQK